jgi:hypothetical protein
MFVANSKRNIIPKKHLQNKNITKVFMLSEPSSMSEDIVRNSILPKYDFVFSNYWIDHPKHFRFPPYTIRLFNYVRYGYDYRKLLIKNSIAKRSKVFIEKRRFCSFIYTNRVAFRGQFFKKLSRTYKPVDSGGRYLNNVGGAIPLGTLPRLDWMEDFKFNISFENTSVPGYISEKLVEPMLVGTIPIYWGDKLVHRDFNTESFVNVHELGDLEKAIQRVKALDQNDDLYFDMLTRPWFNDNELPPYLQEKVMLEKFREIFDR